VSLVAGDGERENFHRSARALPATHGHAGHITCHYDTAGHTLNSRLCRVPDPGGQEADQSRAGSGDVGDLRGGEWSNCLDLWIGDFKFAALFVWRPEAYMVSSPLAAGWELQDEPAVMNIVLMRKKSSRE
jgi:hypothetical protein